MNILNLPDDLLVNLFENYLKLEDLVAISYTCLRFNQIVNGHNLWRKWLMRYPIVDFNYPFGFAKHFASSRDHFEMGNDRYKLEMVQRWIKRMMMPHLQIDVKIGNFPSGGGLFYTEANELVTLDLGTIKNYKQSKEHEKFLSTKSYYGSKSSITNQLVPNRFKIFSGNTDIKYFSKKDQLILCVSEKQIVLELIEEKSPLKTIESSKSFNLTRVLNICDYETDNKINCADFCDDKIVYGCTNGYLNILNFDKNKENLPECNNNIDIDNNDTKDLYSSQLIYSKNLYDRILRCVLAPSLQHVAVGTAGINSYEDMISCPLRIYDLRRLDTPQLLKLPNKNYSHGAGILGLSYIDENTLMSCGYDTFIRIFDLRTNKCIQELEEPEDMSIYCVCTSKYNGLLSGNDRQSLIRYWDRRKNKIIDSFYASAINSPIYSLACTPETIYAGWELGITSIDFSN